MRSAFQAAALALSGLGLSTRAAARAADEFSSAAKPKKAPPLQRKPRGDLVYCEQLTPGRYLASTISQAGLGSRGCHRLPSTSSRSERLAAHRRKMEAKKHLRRSREW